MIFVTSIMNFFHKKRTNRIHTTTKLLDTKHEQEFLQLEAERREFVRCSGMHTQEVRAIVEAVCKKEWSMTHPFSCSEFLIPAFTKGIPEQLEDICSFHGEIAVYSALLMSLFLPLTFDANFSANGHLRARFIFGYYLGWASGWTSIMVSVFFRIAKASMSRESDMLVFLTYSRVLSGLNVLMLLLMLFAMGFALHQGLRNLVTGDYCLDGSLRWDTWWNEWTGNYRDMWTFWRDWYKQPVGQGIFYPEGETIKNPWILKAEELGLTYEDHTSSPWDHPLHSKYNEFLHHHFGFAWDGCTKDEYVYGNLYLMIICSIGVVLFIMTVIRSARLYWTKASVSVPWVPGVFIGETFMYFYNKYFRPDSDPYDMTIAWKDFEKRAEIARKLAGRDVNKDDFIHPTDESAFMTKEDVQVEVPVPPQLEKYRDLLHKANLDLVNMSKVGEDLLNCLLKEAGIIVTGDRLDIINYIHDVSERQ